MRDWDNDGDFGDDYMRQMQNMHMDDKSWADIAYNFCIDPDGLEIYEGRGWGVRPAAQRGHNTATWAVAIMGDFRHLRSNPLIEARIRELVAYGQDHGHLPKGVPMRGHKQAPDQATTCPGWFLMDALPRINAPRTEGLSPWAEDAWQWGLDNGILSASSDPQATVTDERLMVFLQRYHTM
jgi:hypothetical protein